MTISMEFLDSISRHLVVILEKELYYSTILFVLVLSITYFLRNRSPLWQFGLWTLVLIRLILPPDFSLPFSLRNTIERFIELPTLTSSREFLGSDAAGLTVLDDSIGEKEKATILPSTRQHRASGNVTKGSFPYHLILGLGWLIGVLYFFILYLRRLSYYHDLLRHGKRMETDLLQSILNKWKERFGINRPVQIIVTQAFRSPFTMGLIRPRICIPSKLLERGSSATLESTIAHELAHIKCFDSMWLRIQNLIQIVYFFNPIVWFVNSKINQYREGICDSLVLSAGEITPQSYCRGIIEVLRLDLHRKMMFEPVSGYVSHKKNMEKRIIHILQGGISMRKSHLYLIFSLLTIAVLVVLPMSVSVAGPQQVADEEDPVQDEEVLKVIKKSEDLRVKYNKEDGLVIISGEDGEKVFPITDLRSLKDSNVYILKSGDGDSNFSFEFNNMLVGKDFTPLMKATFEGDTATVENLIREGAEVNEANKHKSTALTLAAEFGKTDVAKLLLAEGAEINVQDNDGDSPLLLAIMRDHRDIVDLLMEKGASFEVKNKKGQNPLYFASLNGNVKLVKKLIDSGVDSNSRDAHNSTPLTLAAQFGHEEIARMLISKGAEINIRDNDGDTPLLLSLMKSATTIPDMLIKEGADVFAVNDSGWNTLMGAAGIGNLEIVKTMVKKGLNVNDKNDDGCSALIIAAKAGHVDVVDYLLKKGAAIDAVEDYGRSALMFASFKGHTAVADILIKKGAAVNVKDEHLSTALTLAAEMGHKDIVSLLIDNGAELDAKDKDGDSAMKCAELRKHSDIVKMLQDAGAQE